jgi:hypothetical protein
MRKYRSTIFRKPGSSNTEIRPLDDRIAGQDKAKRSVRAWRLRERDQRDRYQRNEQTPDKKTESSLPPTLAQNHLSPLLVTA